MTLAEYEGGPEEDRPEPPDLPHVDFRVKLNFMDGADLDPEEIEVITEEPLWWEWVRESWESALFGTTRSPRLKVGNLEFSLSYEDWALREGIAPDQSFIVRMHRPTYHKDYYGEVDCDFDIEVIHIEPLEPKEVLRRWEEHFDAQKKYFEASIQQHLADREKQLTDFSAMYLSGSSYYGRHDRYWDEMSYPSAYRYTLHSKHNCWQTSGQLAYGESDNGDHQEAMDKLIAMAVEKVPGITEEIIRKLPKRNCW